MNTFTVKVHNKIINIDESAILETINHFEDMHRACVSVRLDDPRLHSAEELITATVAERYSLDMTTFEINQHDQFFNFIPTALFFQTNDDSYLDLERNEVEILTM